MTSRKMYAPRGWETKDQALFYESYDDISTDVPVLVTDEDGMPDFKPGDRVRSRYSGASYVVTATPAWNGEQWAVPVRDEGDVFWILAKGLTKLPRETSVLLRVTGPESAVEKYAKDSQVPNAYYSCVRVERVEDPDAKGGGR